MKKIVLTVVGAHFLILFCLLLNHWIMSRPKPLRPIAVRTIELPHQIATVNPPKPAQTKPPPPKPAPAKTAPPKPAPIKPTPNPPPKPAQKSSPKPKQPEPPKKTALSIPAPILPSKPVLITTSPSSDPSDPNVKEQLVAYLQSALELPEFGEVKAKIEIDSFGHLKNVEILEAKNIKNGEFLKKRLPELSFPCLNETQSFTLIFKNAETR